MNLLTSVLPQPHLPSLLPLPGGGLLEGKKGCLLQEERPRSAALPLPLGKFCIVSCGPFAFPPGTLPAQWRPNEDSVPRFLPSPQRVGAEKGLLSFFLSVHVTTPLLVQHLKCLCQHHWEKCPPQRKGDRPRFPEMEMPAHVGPAEAQVGSVLFSRAKLLMLLCFYMIRFLCNTVLNIMLHCFIDVNIPAPSGLSTPRCVLNNSLATVSPVCGTSPLSAAGRHVGTRAHHDRTGVFHYRHQ